MISFRLPPTACGRSVQLYGWMETTFLFVKNTPPRDQPGTWLGKKVHITSKLYEFKRVLGAVRGGWTTKIGTSVAVGLIEIGSGLVGLVVFEGPVSMHRYTHRQTDKQGKKLNNRTLFCTLHLFVRIFFSETTWTQLTARYGETSSQRCRFAPSPAPHY